MVTNPALCVTVIAATMEELRRRRDEAANADLVELRLDTVDRPDVAGALADRKSPVIVTCRPAWEGGQFKGSEEERHRILSAAWEGGAELVDVEWRAPFRDLVTPTRALRTVLSSHAFDAPLSESELGELLAAMSATGVAVIKVAMRTDRLSDTLPLLTLGSRAHEQGRVLIGMGPAGVVTRVCAARFGSRWTYAGPLDEAGQVSTTSMVEEYGFRRIGPETQLYGVVGRPVGHSLSPVMHNAGFRTASLDAVYLPLEARDWDDFERFAEAFDVRGVSVTAPYKRDAFRVASERDATSTASEAVNTLRRNDGAWVARNTDVQGFLAPLGGRSLTNVRVSVLGAGGAARAVAIGLRDSGARVTLHARRSTEGADVARSVGVAAGPWPPDPGTWDLLVNATPFGTAPAWDQSPMQGEPLTGSTVYDLVYNPEETRVLKDARAAGCEVIGGLDMLVAQACEQFRWWTGVEPSPAAFREAAAKTLRARAKTELQPHP